MTLNRKIRVLHVIPAMQVGGAERAIVNLLRIFDAGSDVESLLCVLGNEGWLYDYRPKNQPLYLHFRSSWRAIGPARRCVRHLRSVMDDFKPDILHSHLWMANFFGALTLRKRTGVVQVCHIHNTWEWLASSQPGFRIRRILYRRALQASRARFITCSDAAGIYHQQHLRLPAALFRTIPYGIDTALFSREDDPTHEEHAGKTVVIGTAGRFVESKGHEHLLRAFAKLRSRNQALRLCIAGEGGLRPHYEAVCRELRIADAVEFAGSVRNMPAFYRSLDIYAQPSVSAEGLPIAILEAMGAGLPVVATDVAGACEAVRQGREGFLVRPGDIESLTRRLEELVLNPVLRHKLGNTARRRLEAEFAMETMANRVLACYRDLIAHRF